MYKLKEKYSMLQNIEQDVLLIVKKKLYIKMINFESIFVKIGANYRNLAHYNKRCPYRPSDFTRV
jgi:hypothetical protein